MRAACSSSRRPTTSTRARTTRTRRRCWARRPSQTPSSSGNANGSCCEARFPTRHRRRAAAASTPAARSHRTAAVASSHHSKRSIPANGRRAGSRNEGGSMTQTTVDPLVERLAALPTASLCDAFLKSGTYPAERLVMRKVRPLGSLQTRAAGRARTQQLVSLRDKARGSVVANRHLHFELVDRTRPGDFLVVAVAGSDLLASFGDILALKAKAMGAAGVVVDGATRDAAFIE